MNSTSTWLFNPFLRVAGLKSLLWGLVAVLGAAIIGFVANTHFDGVIDMHLGSPSPMWEFIAENLIDWLFVALVLLVAGRLISKTSFRTIDLVGTQSLARWPTLIMAILTMSAGYRRFTNSILQTIVAGGRPDFSSPDGPTFIIVTALLTILLIWMILLMYRSFSVACNVKGIRGIVTFIVALIIAETLSKFAITALARHIL